MAEVQLARDIQAGRPTDEFRAIVEGLAFLLAREGLLRKPYLSADLPLFSKLDQDTQLRVLASLRDYYAVLMESSQEGTSLRDTPVLVWKMLKRLGLTPTDDLFSYISHEKVVEIYNLENVQIFRNFRFFEICSYTLEELFCKQWWELFRRDDTITQQIFAVAAAVYGGETKGSAVPQVGTHLLEEICSPLSFKMEVDIDCLSPLYHRDRIVAGCAVERARLLNEPTKDVNEVRERLSHYYEGNV